MNPAVPAPVQALARSPELDAFCGALERFLDTGEGADQLPTHAVALVTEARSRHVPPEHILLALRISRCNVGHGHGRTEQDREVGRRYAQAIALLLRYYFHVAESDLEPVGDVTRARTAAERAFRAEAAVRMVPDSASGALWRVERVHEGYTWDPVLEPLRRAWLSCESGEERRYITPAPADWLDWKEDLLLAAIRSAPLDRRQDDER
jgi:hypothetical protein